MTYDDANKYLKSRKSALTTAGSMQIARTIPAKVRMQSFFSARVGEERVVQVLRNVSDKCSRGELGVGEARLHLKKWLDGNMPGVYDSKDDVHMKNLASTARLNLILRQNAAQAAAVGRYTQSMDPDIQERWPNLKYHVGPNSRDNHRLYDNLIFAKTDPIWQKIYPPWDFNCNCDVEDTEEQARPSKGMKHELPPSGYEFNPVKPYEDYDLSTMDATQLAEIEDKSNIRFADQVSFEDSVAKFHPENYDTYEKHALPSVQSWKKAEAPALVLPETAEKRLTAGFSVAAPDGQKVVFSKAILDHWKRRPKSYVTANLGCLDYAAQTVVSPTEEWTLATSRRYLKIFEKTAAGYDGCIVTVLKNGDTEVFFLNQITDMDLARFGAKYKIYYGVKES